jgi:hypothetical protein
MSGPEIPASSSSPLAREIEDFRDLCVKRYRFNNRLDVALTVAGIALGIAVVAAGTWKQAEIGAILGAVVTAVVSAQRAFPFTQRAQFYRSLVGQSENLKSSLEYNLITATVAVKVLETLRLDFAQQLPRGTTSDAASRNPQDQPTSPASPTQSTQETPITTVAPPSTASATVSATVDGGSNDTPQKH